MVRMVPVLGTLVLFGSIVQVILGFMVADRVTGVREFHMLFGVIGLGLVILLTILAFRGKYATTYSKLIMTLVVIAVLIQVAFGFQLVARVRTLETPHQLNGFLIVILALAMGGVTFQNAKKQTQAMT